MPGSLMPGTGSARQKGSRRGNATGVPGAVPVPGLIPVPGIVPAIPLAGREVVTKGHPTKTLAVVPAPQHLRHLPARRLPVNPENPPVPVMRPRLIHQSLNPSCTPTNCYVCALHPDFIRHSPGYRLDFIQHSPTLHPAFTRPFPHISIPTIRVFRSLPDSILRKLFQASVETCSILPPSTWHSTTITFPRLALPVISGLPALPVLSHASAQHRFSCNEDLLSISHLSELLFLFFIVYDSISFLGYFFLSRYCL